MSTTKCIKSAVSVFALTVLVVAAPATFAGAAESSAMSQTVVKGSVDQVLGALQKMIAEGGMMVMGELHQGKVLEMTGLKIKSESIFVGNPTVGKQLFEAEPGAGIALPVRVNIFENAEGKTVVAYIPPSRQLAGFANPMLDRMAVMLDEKLASMVAMIGN
jgi:uncharacterized protein (DUF302 family)